MRDESHIESGTALLRGASVSYLWVLWLLLSCTPEEAIPFDQCRIPTVPDTSLRIDSEQFWLHNEPLVPHGINSYPLLQHIGDEDIQAVRDIFSQALRLGRPYIRTNGFMDGGTHPARTRTNDGSIRTEGLESLDRVVQEAADAGVALLLILTNNWEDYGGAAAVVEMVAPGEGLPKDAFWSDPRALEAQREYVQTIVSRANHRTGKSYADDPTIIGFELCNEARCDDPDWCDSRTLGDWAMEMSTAIREAGASQPIFWGGQGFMGEHGEDLRDIARRGGVDVLTFHLYLHYSHAYLYTLPDDLRIQTAIDVGQQLIQSRSAVAHDVGLPLVIEEMGWKAESAPDPDGERAAIYEGWLAAAHAEGLATLPWMIGETGRPDYDGLLIRPNDTATWEILSCN